MFSFLSPYKWLIVSIAVLAVLGYIGYLKYDNVKLEDKVTEQKLKIEELKKENEKLETTNKENKEKYEKDIAALNTVIKDNEKICKDKVSLIRKQLDVCYATTCTNIQPGLTSGEVQVLDGKSSKLHLDFYNEAVKQFNNRSLGNMKVQ
jgi:cell division protein FtsB